jgi:hypothetical protein
MVAMFAILIVSVFLCKCAFIDDSWLECTCWASIVPWIAWPFIVVLILIVFAGPIRGLISSIPDILRKSKISLPGVTIEPSTASLGEKEPVSVAGITIEGVQKPDQADRDLLLHLLKESEARTTGGDHIRAVEILQQANILFPNQWQILHNLGAVFIRLFKHTGSSHPEYLVQAESACRTALSLLRVFPYGTHYNLARAQALGGNIQGLRETLSQMRFVDMPHNLAKALADGDKDIRASDEIAELPEYQAVVAKMKSR